jgi:hypothetical protein
MNAPSAVELLDAWEAAVSAAPEAAAVDLLDRLAGPDVDTPAIDLPLGDRDRLLLDLRERLFGPRLTAAVSCASCGERLELAFTVADVLVPPAGEGQPVRRVSIASDRGEIAFRLPTTRDTLAIVGAADVAEARRRLVARLQEAPAAAGQTSLSDTELDALDLALANADPQATVELETACAQCGADIASAFDVARHLAAEIDAWARRTLHEVATLAAAYGWREQDILGMSAWRRGYYLQAVGA